MDCLATLKQVERASYIYASRNGELEKMHAVNARVKEIKSIRQVKGQTKILLLIKSQSKYLAGKTFE